jgi:hypothetical protein
MAARRSFTPEGIPVKSADYHGIATVAKTSPDIAAKGLAAVNVYVPFEEALKLSLAIQSCVTSLNRYNRKSAVGRDMGLLLSLKGNTITVIETRVAPPPAP